MKTISLRRCGMFSWGRLIEVIYVVYISVAIKYKISWYLIFFLIHFQSMYLHDIQYLLITF